MNQPNMDFALKKTLTLLLCLPLLLPAGCTKNPQQQDSSGTDDVELVPKDVALHSKFTDDFTDSEPVCFNCSYRTTRDDFRYYSGVPSLSEKNTEILMLRIDPADPAGESRGPEILSSDYVFYGTYSARVRVPDIRKAQPNVGAVAGFSVYDTDSSYGCSEISFEWRIADPEIIYLGTVTGRDPDQNSLNRTINLASGTIYGTSWKAEVADKYGKTETTAKGTLSGAQNEPATISPLEDYDASSGFHVYGFDWYPERITWWILHPDTGEKIVLWDYEGTELFPGKPSTTGIPVIPARYRLNFWHSKISPAENIPSSVESPLYPYELEVDWISYEPADELNNAWREEHFN